MNPHRVIIAIAAIVLSTGIANAQPIEVEGQPLAGNITRLLKALDFIGQPLPQEVSLPLERAVKLQVYSGAPLMNGFSAA